MRTTSTRSSEAPASDEPYSEQLVRTKIIRNKSSGQPEGYGFVEFATHARAEMMLQALAGIQMPHSEQMFRLNWACPGGSERGPEKSSIFVGDLGPEVSESMLLDTFRSRYSSVRGAKVVTDAVSGRSRGYGFVRFGDETEKLWAMVEMNGVYCSSRPMRIGAANSRRALVSALPKVFNPLSTANVPLDNDLNNTTVFVGGLDPGVSAAELQKIFGEYGEISHVKIIPGKCCGFIQFTHRSCAEEALSKLHGTTIRQQPIRLSWGRTSTKPGWYYGYGYDGSGYYGDSYASYGDYQDNTGYIQGDYDPSLEVFDPMTPPDIDRWNAEYVCLHEKLLLGRNLSLLRMSEQAAQQA